MLQDRWQKGRFQDVLKVKALLWGNEACLAGVQGVVKYACSEEVPEPVDLQGLLLPFSRP